MPWLVVALIGTLMFVWTTPAGATTYCAQPATGCGGGDHPTLAAALNAALNNAGADDVRLGAGGYTDGPWSYDDPTGTNPVTIRGAGFLESQLASPGGGPTLALNNGNADNVVVRAPAAGVAVNLVSGTLSNSQVLVTNNGRGVDAAGATLDHVSIVPAGGGNPGPHTAVRADQTTVRDSSMSTTNGVEVSNPPVAVRRSIIVTKGHGLESGWSGTAISDSLIVLDDPTAVGVQGICDLSIGTITIDATNLTVTGGGSGVAFRSIGGQGCGGHVAVSSSLVHGVGTTADCAPGVGSASVAVRYSDADLAGAGKVTGTCSGPVDAGNNFFADPKLASPGTLQPVPRFDSPLVDAGDPAPPGAGQPTDLAGLPRAVNGRRDVGAFEYGRRAPSLSIAASPAAVLTAEPVTFTATTSDPDLGDAVTVGWSFDDGTSATGPQVSHAFATAGTHTATATATDSAGVMTARAVTVAVTGPKQVILDTTKDTTKPSLTALSLSSSKFRSAKSGASVSKAKVGTRVRFTLSEPSSVAFTVQRPVAGRQVAKRCVKPRRSNRKKTRCTRWVAVQGSFAIAGKAGANSFTFRGRIGRKRLKPGAYRLSAQATDPAKNISAPKRKKFKIVR